MGQPPSVPLRLLSSAPLLTVLLVGAMAARQLWVCFFRRPKFGRWTWCISYHAAALALVSFSLRWRENPLDPAVIAWAVGLLAGAAWARWWRLPNWVASRKGVTPRCSSWQPCSCWSQLTPRDEFSGSLRAALRSRRCSCWLLWPRVAARKSPFRNSRQLARVRADPRGPGRRWSST